MNLASTKSAILHPAMYSLFRLKCFILDAHMNTKSILFVALVFCLYGCSRKAPVAANADKLILRFEIDSNGNILNDKVKLQVLALAKELEKSADKMMMTAYSEQSGNEEQNEKTAKAMARAVRELMKTQGERNATNVGVDIKGYQNPIDSIHPENIINRRIEIAPL